MYLVRGALLPSRLYYPLIKFSELPPPRHPSMILSRVPILKRERCALHPLVKATMRCVWRQALRCHLWRSLRKPTLLPTILSHGILPISPSGDTEMNQGEHMMCSCSGGKPPELEVKTHTHLILVHMSRVHWYNSWHPPYLGMRWNSDWIIVSSSREDIGVLLECRPIQILGEYINLIGSTWYPFDH